MEAALTFLLGLRPTAFANGRFAFETGSLTGLLIAMLAAVSVVGFLYHRQRARLGNRRALLLAGSRTLVLTLLAAALMRPVLRVSTAVPGENFLAVLIDDSRSMRLPQSSDNSGPTRGDVAVSTFAPGSSRWLEELESRFSLRFYRFAEEIGRHDPAAPLTFDGGATHLGQVLDRVRQDLAAVPLAGAVLLSDGADNAPSGSDALSSSDAVSLDEALLQLASRRIPIYTVGLGEERFRRDIQLSRVTCPDRVLAGSAFAIEAQIEARGYDGQTVRLSVESAGGIVATRDVELPSQAAAEAGTSVRIHLEAEEAGTRRYSVRVETQPDEAIAENNRRDVLVTVEDRREKILYFEGEPRFEVKFLRLALRGDDNLQVVVLQRTAENKFLRLGVDDALELATGFPSTREELFAYSGLILGSVEASFFTADQLRIIEDFVSQRGGGLLLLGGRRSFATGGYRDTPLANVSPVVLEDAPLQGKSFLEVSLLPTTAGEAHTALQLGESPEASLERWNTLPPLSTRHRLSRIKPGASLLLSAKPTDNATDDLVGLASQRYGKGRVLAFPIQDSWMWQMHASIPLEDMTHERLWRQTLRWLIRDVPRRLELEVSESRVAPGQTLELRAAARDAAFLGVNGARVEATITDPLGDVTTAQLDWTIEDDGDYRSTLSAEHPGRYEIEAIATSDGEELGRDVLVFDAADRAHEYFDAEMNRPLLRRIADTTGGRFYTPGNLAGLARDARFTQSGKTVIEHLTLWDMPLVFFLLVGSLAAEWLLRRRWGLP